jgi:hypothetical protein
VSDPKEEKPTQKIAIIDEKMGIIVYIEETEQTEYLQEE